MPFLIARHRLRTDENEGRDPSGKDEPPLAVCRLLVAPTEIGSLTTMVFHCCSAARGHLVRRAERADGRTAWLVYFLAPAAECRAERALFQRADVTRFAESRAHTFPPVYGHFTNS